MKYYGVVNELGNFVLKGSSGKGYAIYSNRLNAQKKLIQLERKGE